jgi:hypothetical protein
LYRYIEMPNVDVYLLSVSGVRNICGLMRVVRTRLAQRLGGISEDEDFSAAGEFFSSLEGKTAVVVARAGDEVGGCTSCIQLTTHNLQAPTVVSTLEHMKCKTNQFHKPLLFKLNL